MVYKLQLVRTYFYFSTRRQTHVEQTFSKEKGNILFAQRAMKFACWPIKVVSFVHMTTTAGYDLLHLLKECTSEFIRI